jgi:hypothetical protein
MHLLPIMLLSSHLTPCSKNINVHEERDVILRGEVQQRLDIV